MSLSLAGVRVLSLDLHQFWGGPWIADCILDPDAPTNLPSGPVTLSIQSGESDTLTTPTLLQGTVDANYSGTFLSRASARVVGGAGAWDSTLPTQNFHSDNGVLSTTVYTQTANQIGEKIKDLNPVLLGVDIIRPLGPASAIFPVGAQWWVDFTGVTNVGSRPSTTPDSTFEILDFDPLDQRLEFTSDVPILPGTVISGDARLNGQVLTLRDVHQHFSHGKGARGVGLCGVNPTSRLQTAVTNLVTNLATRALLRAYRYRVIQYQGNRLALQAVGAAPNVPNLIPLTPWYGLPGITAQAASSSQIIVVFDHSQEPPQPISVAYDSVAPAESIIIAVTQSLALGDSHGDALVKKIPYQALLQALSTFAGAMAAAATGPLAPLAAPATALQTAISNLPPPATTKVTGT